MIRMIVAVDRKHGIAKQEVLPWNIPDDQQYFADETKRYGANVLVGSLTFEQMGALSDRQTYVLTSKSTPLEGATVVNNLNEFLNEFKGDLWIIGGANLYKQALNRANELYITEIDADFKCDKFFPEYKDKFELVEESVGLEQNGFNYRFCRYMKSI